MGQPAAGSRKIVFLLLLLIILIILIILPGHCPRKKETLTGTPLVLFVADRG